MAFFRHLGSVASGASGTVPPPGGSTGGGTGPGPGGYGEAAGNPAGLAYAGTLTINTGGTYDGVTLGNYARVVVNTTSPVTIQHMAIKGPPPLVDLSSGAKQVTVRNCYLEGTSGITSSNRAIGSSANLSSLTVENCKISNCPGIKIIGATNLNSLSIRFNKVRNIVGNANWATDPTHADFVQFAQFDNVFTPTGGPFEIAWNEVINFPGQSWVEDNISYYRCGGPDTTHRWLTHHNLLWGAFPYNYTVDTGFSGGGIMHNDFSVITTGHLETYNNVVLGTTNYGISCVGGTDAYIHDNKVIGSGRTQDGTAVLASQGGGPVGLALWKPGWQPAGTPTNNKFQNNTVGWWRSVAASRNDYWWDSTGMPAASGNDLSGVTLFKSGLSLVWQDEKDAYDIWNAGRLTAAVSIGPNW